MIYMTLRFLFEKDKIFGYVKGPLIFSLLFLIASISLFVCGFFNRYMFAFSCLLFLPSILLFVTAVRGYKRYGRKITVDEQGVTVYTAKEKAFHCYKYNEYNAKRHIIKLDYAGGSNNRIESFHKECLVLYRDMELYEGMEYRDYWNDKNILIIQNPEAIAEVEKYIS